MLQEPPSSPYDLRFEIFGFQVRVFWGFWAMALLLGWQFSYRMVDEAEFYNLESPGAPVFLLIWVAAIFISILVHELGHTFAFRYYRVDSHIVLYHFGGLAVPGGVTAWDGARRGHIGAQEQLVISAAGPALQLILGLIVVAAGYALEYPMSILGFAIGPADAQPHGSMALYAAVQALIFPSIAWALLNLLPVLPLDGGQIMRSLLFMNNVNRPNQTALMVSIGCAAFVAILSMTTPGFQFLGMMMLFMAFSNYQALQMHGGF